MFAEQMNPKTKLIADTVYLIGNMSGSILIASNIGLNVFGFMLFTVGSLAGVYLLKNSNASKSLLFITCYFLVVNVIGIIRS